MLHIQKRKRRLLPSNTTSRSNSPHATTEHYRTKISRAGGGQDPPQRLARLEDAVPKRVTPLVERLARLLGPLLPLPELRRQHRVHASELQLYIFGGGESMHA